MAKSNIIIIHGGNSYNDDQEYEKFLSSKDIWYRSGNNTSDWKQNFTNFFINITDIKQPIMPSKDNAKFEQWKIVFEKLLTEINEDTILIGHSLGGAFLAVYFSQYAHLKSIKVKQIHLVAPDFKEGNFVFNPEEKFLDNIKKSTKELHLWQSDDDPALAYTNGLEYRKYEEVFTQMHIFTNLGHFNSSSFTQLSIYLFDSLS